MKKIINIAFTAAALMAAVACAGPKSGSTDKGNEKQEVNVAELEKVYDDEADPAEQIRVAISQAKESGRFVICQVGGNWCRWCLMFADYISKDEEIASEIEKNFVYVHVNVRRQNESGRNETCTEAMEILGNPMRFGYPVLVVLDGDGKVLHTQDSGYLESGEGYDKEKVLRFFRNWSPAAVNQSNTSGQ